MQFLTGKNKQIDLKNLIMSQICNNKKFSIRGRGGGVCVCKVHWNFFIKKKFTLPLSSDFKFGTDFENIS